jgi:hypothetical protein
MMIKNSLFGLIFLTLVICVSCNTEREYIGAYTIFSYKKDNGNDIQNGSNSYLLLENNHFFKINIENKVFNGEWRFHDTGDNSMIDFFLKKKGKLIKYQSLVGVIEKDKIIITIINPHLFFEEDSLKEVVFIK